MNCTTTLSLKEGFISQAERRKRLGQYFSGVGLASLLASLAQAHDAKSIIDPMGGSGDMLVGCAAIGASPRTVASIEIDPVAQEVCSARNPSAHCLRGNVFDKEVIKKLPLNEWDLVITNPPYVRYQSLSNGAGIGYPLPSATEIRDGLAECLDRMTALDNTDKKLFAALIRGYSGFADLAVPSWLLSAAMVTKGGRLALVLPESWLSREYATVVSYLLFRWFRLEYIVEDDHAVWFGDTQVKTLLLVAQRVERKSSAFEWGGDDHFVKIRLDGRAADTCGPIAKLPVVGNARPEAYLTSMAQEVLYTGTSRIDEFSSIIRSSILNYSRSLLKSCRDQKWFREMEDIGNIDGGRYVKPIFFDDWINADIQRPLVYLESIGVTIGQGLRTGANEFFYSSLRKENAEDVEVTVGEFGNNVQIELPFSCAIPVIRRQSELPVGYVIRKNELTGRVLDFSSIALPEDIESGGELARKFYEPMPKNLADFVRSVAQVNVGSEAKPERIWELSAVSPNVRKSNPKLGSPPRFWYMLPPFRRRHRPDIIIPRVIGETVKAWIISDPGIIVDANFSTLTVEEGGPGAFAVLAVLNSTWSRVALEFGATVMGGGALKVEATHLRQLPVPDFSTHEWQRLAVLGQRLIIDGDVREIDSFVAEVLLGRRPTMSEMARLSSLLAKGRSRRKGVRRSTNLG